MTNFAFLPNHFSEIAAAATQAEGHLHGDTRAAWLHARFAREAALHRLCRFEGRLNHKLDERMRRFL